MQSYPAEIWEAILTQLPSCYPDPKELSYKRGLSGYLVCALTCRAVSDIARPHIFKTVVIYNAHRASLSLRTAGSSFDNRSCLNEIAGRIDVRLDLLTKLEVTPTEARHDVDDTHSFRRLQFLLEHAPQLEQLTLARCCDATIRDLDALDFKSNLKLQCIEFEGISGFTDPWWYARALDTLPRITQVHFRQGSIQGQDRYKDMRPRSVGYFSICETKETGRRERTASWNDFPSWLVVVCAASSGRPVLLTFSRGIFRAVSLKVPLNVGSCARVNLMATNAMRTQTSLFG